MIVDGGRGEVAVRKRACSEALGPATAAHRALGVGHLVDELLGGARVVGRHHRAAVVELGHLAAKDGGPAGRIDEQVGLEVHLPPAGALRAQGDRAAPVELEARAVRAPAQVDAGFVCTM